MQHSMKIRCLQTDRGGEYLSEAFNYHLKAQGMVWSLTVHDTPEENSVSERLKCTLLEHACAMIIASCLPKFLWTEAIQHTVWLKNHTATHALDSKTPFEVLFKQKPNLQDLPEWGTHVVVLHEGRGKLDKKAN